MLSHLIGGQVASASTIAELKDPCVIAYIKTEFSTPDSDPITNKRLSEFTNFCERQRLDDTQAAWGLTQKNAQRDALEK